MFDGKKGVCKGAKATKQGGLRSAAKVPYGQQGQYEVQLTQFKCEFYEDRTPIDGKDLITASQVVPVCKPEEDIPSVSTTCSEQSDKLKGEYSTCSDQYEVKWDVWLCESPTPVVDKNCRFSSLSSENCGFDNLPSVKDCGVDSLSSAKSQNKLVKSYSKKNCRFGSSSRKTDRFGSSSRKTDRFGSFPDKNCGVRNSSNKQGKVSTVKRGQSYIGPPS